MMKKKTTPRMHSDKPTGVANISSKHLQNVSVNKESSSQKQHETLKIKQHKSQVRGSKKLAIDVKDGDKVSLNGKTRQKKPAERKQQLTMKAEHLTQALPSKQFSLPAVKKLQNAVFKKDVSPSNESKASIAVNDKSTDKKCQNKKSNSKKKQNGTSNWMKLCATLNIDATVRKTKPTKRPATDSVTEQAEHSEPKRTKPGIWFDNVDKILIETDTVEKDVVGTNDPEHDDTTDRLVKPDSFKGVTNCLAMDCEMVGVGHSGEDSILARVSIVNHFGVCLYDKFVLPREKVTDYRTYVSGVTAENLATGDKFTNVQSEVSNLITGRILVGHAVHNDLKVLFLTHPHKMIRDTSLYKPFRGLFNGRLPSLKKLTEKVLGVQVQEGQHSSVQDAQATMRLYTMHRQKWEKELRKERQMDRKKKKKKQLKKESV